MNMNKNLGFTVSVNKLLLSAMVVLLSYPCALLQSATIPITDVFSGATISSNVVTSPSGMTYKTMAGTNTYALDTTSNIVNGFGSFGGLGGQNLKLTQNAFAKGYSLFNMPAGTPSLASGQSITLSFYLQFSSVAAQANGLRFGLYNNLEGASPTVFRDAGYYFQTNAGSVSATGSSLSYSNGTPASQDLSGFTSSVGSTFNSISSGTTDVYRYSMTITNTANGSTQGNTIALMVQDLSAGTTPINVTRLDTNNVSLNTFNMFTIGSGGTAQTYFVDNIQLTVVPEPSSIVLLSCGLTLIFRRIRSRHASIV